MTKKKKEPLWLVYLSCITIWISVTTFLPIEWIIAHITCGIIATIFTMQQLNFISNSILDLKDKGVPLLSGLENFDLESPFDKKVFLLQVFSLGLGNVIVFLIVVFVDQSSEK